MPNKVHQWLNFETPEFTHHKLAKREGGKVS